jgi:transposase
VAGLARRIRAVHDGVQSLQPMEQAGHLAGDFHRLDRRRSSCRADDDRQFRGQGASLGERRKRGERGQAIGRSRGGRTTKIHALIDGQGRPIVFLLSGGNVADITTAAPLLTATAASAWLIADKGYDADHLRAFLDSRGTTAVIPHKTNRKRLFPFDPERYKWRNVIERTYCRLKDFRAIATRYHKTARNFLAGLCLIAAWPIGSIESTP